MNANTLIIWSFPLAVLLHNIEEALWLPAWSRQQSGKWHNPVGEFEFRFAVTVFTLLAFLIAGLTASYGRGSIWHYLLASYALGQGVNILIPHLAATTVTKVYAPGLLTGVLFVWPSAIVVLYSALANDQLDPARFAITAVIFIPAMMLSIPLLFRIGKMIKSS